MREDEGREIAGFRIESEIGRGGMGVVYLAHQSFPERKVALKLLSPEALARRSMRSARDCQEGLARRVRDVAARDTQASTRMQTMDATRGGRAWCPTPLVKSCSGDDHLTNCTLNVCEVSSLSPSSNV